MADFPVRRDRRTADDALVTPLELRQDPDHPGARGFTATPAHPVALPLLAVAARSRDLWAVRAASNWLRCRPPGTA